MYIFLDAHEIIDADKRIKTTKIINSELLVIIDFININICN